MGPNPTGGMTSLGAATSIPGGWRLGTVIRPYVSRTSGRAPRGLGPSGLPAARSYVSGMLVNRCPSWSAPWRSNCRPACTSMLLSISPAASRTRTERTGCCPGAKACPTSTTSARGFIGTRSHGA